ncbi:3-hydroxyacyl-ACP dehydratase [Agriterribacter sp.]|uniref:3-hydroxyacyl-ACP dehydratase n=1 Tax=Agriterribacter sp. TaxID=2821509 RepID=UPI002BF0A766|nr:3-hydroxyacyl-ACP dehydratase [Agriterribacter sp.]HRO44241.1 3-hydroxyacyl-ACP dehydratase [Agriterribacter sp.]HRQ18862.1 3-hydroxyacyl-ACP dehydratase [Agriterribacter sp.]
MKDILAFIPQRPPFVMVDELVAVDNNAGTTKFKVSADNIFTVNGKLTEPALIENIAQTAAARIGYICSQKKEPVPVGFIGAVQNLQVMNLPEPGQLLETTIEIKNQVFDITVITGKITCKGTVLAQCEMKIFIQSTNKSAMI